MLKVSTGEETLFWYDRWLEGKVSMYLWPEEFAESQQKNGPVQDLTYLLESSPFVDNLAIAQLRDQLKNPSGNLCDQKRWLFTGNGSFLVMSFYNLLNDGGLRCQAARFFSRNTCHKKINLFNWLVWKDKILTLEALSRQWCNQLPTATCVYVILALSLWTTCSQLVLWWRIYGTTLCIFYICQTRLFLWVWFGVLGKLV